MKVTYNGVEMKLVEMVECEREAVYDESGTDLLYVRWRLGLVCTLASGGYPGGTAVDFARKRGTVLDDRPSLAGRGPRDNNVIGGSRPSAPWSAIAASETDPLSVATAANSAFITDAELHTRLMTPRKKLKITAANPDGTDYVWLESPRVILREAEAAPGPPDLTVEAARAAFPARPMTDSANGPTPLRADVVQPSGELGTFGVHFVIETCLAPTTSADERLVLSHRWQTSMQSNADHFLTRVIVGEVRFSGAILSVSATHPDWYRSQFFHPIPLGFRRDVPDVSLSPDGLTLRYEIHDTDPTVTFDPGDSGATEIDIVETNNLITRNLWAANANDLVNRLMSRVTGNTKVGGSLIGQFLGG